VTLEDAVEALRERGFGYDRLDQLAWDFLAEECDGPTRTAFIDFLLRADA